MGHPLLPSLAVRDFGLAALEALQPPTSKGLRPSMSPKVGEHWRHPGQPQHEAVQLSYQDSGSADPASTRPDMSMAPLLMVSTTASHSQIASIRLYLLSKNSEICGSGPASCFLCKVPDEQPRVICARRKVYPCKTESKHAACGLLHWYVRGAEAINALLSKLPQCLAEAPQPSVHPSRPRHTGVLRLQRLFPPTRQDPTVASAETDPGDCSMTMTL